MRMLFNPSQADPPSQVEVQVPGGVVPQGDMDRVMAFSEGLVEGWSLGGRKIADWYPGFPRGERVRYAVPPRSWRACGYAASGTGVAVVCS